MEACPEDAIRMVKDVPDLPSFDRRDMSGKIDLLQQWRPTSDPRKPYPAPPPYDQGRHDGTRHHLRASRLIFAVLVVVLRQPMRAALALIAHMISLAAIFACLNVHVVALFQVLIYVGAVMVLMIYTIMLLDDSDPSYVKSSRAGRCRRSSSRPS